MRLKNTKPSKNFKDDQEVPQGWNHFLEMDNNHFTIEERELMEKNQRTPEDIQILRTLKYIGVPKPLRKQ